MLDDLRSGGLSVLQSGRLLRAQADMGPPIGNARLRNVHVAYWPL